MLIAGELQNTFEGVLNELVKLTEQGKFDYAIQKVNSDYQKRSVAARFWWPRSLRLEFACW